MRRKIMTAFVCAIMTISVIPVYADDTQTDQAVTDIDSGFGSCDFIKFTIDFVF